MASVEEILEELWADPRLFEERGRGGELLQKMFEGASLEVLLPLLASEDAFVQRNVAFVVSELGKAGAVLLDEVVQRLLGSAEIVVRRDALDAIAACARGARSDRFWNVVRHLEDQDGRIRQQVMRLMSRADVEQLEAARVVFEAMKGPEVAHIANLTWLLNRDLGEAEILERISSGDPLARRYGAVAAKRLESRWPSAMKSARSSFDADLREFE